MRLTTFEGMYPKIDSQDSPPKAAILAENCDLYSGRIDPFPALGNPQTIVNINGMVDPEGKYETLYRAGSVLVGFPEHTFVVEDISRRAGDSTFLFVQDGKLKRSSGEWLLAKREPEIVGVSSPLLAPILSVSTTGGAEILSPPDMLCETDVAENCEEANPEEVRAYLMTYVSRSGCASGDEESAPSPASEIVEVPEQGSVILVDPNTPPSNAVARRYYRSVVSSEGRGVWLYVGESPIDAVAFVDGVHPFDLGAPLTTENWLPPPECLDGVAVLGDGLTVVWSGERFWVSEPRLPHAYSPVHKYELRFPIVAMVGVMTPVEGAVHHNILCVTKGNPYAIVGELPEMVDIKELQVWEPAVTPYGFTVGEGFMAYVSEFGLCAFTGGEVTRLLDNETTDLEWQAFDLRTLKLQYWNGRLWAFGKERSFVYPFTRHRKDRPSTLVMLTLHPTAAYASPDFPLTLAFGNVATQWGKGTGRMQARWLSRVFTLPGHWWPAAMKVVADFPPENNGAKRARRAFEAWVSQNRKLDKCRFFELNPQFAEYEGLLTGSGPWVHTRLTADDREIVSRQVHSSKPFRVPRVRRGIDWTFEIVTNVPVREVHLETSIQDLTQLGLGVGNSV